MWVYLLMEDAIAKAVLQELEIYVSLHHTTVAQFIATRTIMDLFLAVELRLGPRVSKWWW